MIELFLKSISEHNIFMLWGAISAFLIWFLWQNPTYRHKRWRNWILLSAFALCAILSFYFLGLLSVPTMPILITLLAGYVLLGYKSVKKAFIPESLSISILENLVREGAYTTIEKRFSKRPFYIISIPGKFKWGLIWANKLREQGRLKEAYKVYCWLLDLPLFEDEKNDIRAVQALTLLLLGDTVKAKSIFQQITIKTGRQRCRSLHLQSWFDEREGGFEKARQNLLAAVSEYNSSKEVHLATIYNNLGRMEGMLGNKTAVVHYYRKSAEVARQHREKSTIHTVYPNLIDVYLLLNDYKNAAMFLEDYSTLIDKTNVDDVLRFNNYRLQYARQTNNRALFLEALVQGAIELIPKIPIEERLVFESSELRIRWSWQYGWDEKLFWLKQHLPRYIELQFPKRYLTLKEPFIILSDLAKENKLGPFGGFFSELVGFMNRSKEDIDEYLDHRLPDYCVDEWCYWEKEKAFLHRIRKKDDPQMPLKDYYERLFMHLDNIRDIQLQHGNPLPAIEADLNIADECMWAIKESKNANILLYLSEIMEKHLNRACQNIERFRGHPTSNEYALRIARYTLFLGEKEKAEEYFGYFIRSKIGILHYYPWLQRYYQELIQAGLCKTS